MLPRILFLAALLALAGCGEDEKSSASREGEILRELGARGRAGLPQEQLDAYAATFGFLDADENGLVSIEEYEANSIFGNSFSARGVFGATDRDASGQVTLDEYVENRIITDEAKEIHHQIDVDGSGGVSRDELVLRTSWSDALEGIFVEFDRDGDGEIVQIEWLITWGNWARLPGVGLV